jgi:predicted tellurium resistance membrane protein TerC
LRPDAKDHIMEWISSPEAWIALFTLTVLEIVLGIDNIIFISILVDRLPEHQQKKARLTGLAMAMVLRILLLLSISWVMNAQNTLITIGSVDTELQPIAEKLILNEDLIHETTDPAELKQMQDAQAISWRLISWRDIILLIGGLFLIWKSTQEIHHSLAGIREEEESSTVATYGSVLAQIAILDLVFSLDSVITAVGMAKHIPVMVIAIVIAVGVMMLAAQAIGEFVENNPTIKMLALSFLILVGTALLGEGMGFHIPKGYIYFAMAFAVGVELLNLKMRKNAEKPVKLIRHNP